MEVGFEIDHMDCTDFDDSEPEPVQDLDLEHLAVFVDSVRTVVAFSDSDYKR